MAKINAKWVNLHATLTADGNNVKVNVDDSTALANDKFWSSTYINQKINDAITGLSWHDPVEYVTSYKKSDAGAPTGDTMVVGEVCMKDHTTGSALYKASAIDTFGSAFAFVNAGRYLFGIDGGEATDAGTNTADKKIYVAKTFTVIQYIKTGAPIGVGATNDEYCLDTTNVKLYKFVTGAWADQGTPTGNTYHSETGDDTGGDAGTHTASFIIYNTSAAATTMLDVGTAPSGNQTVVTKEGSVESAGAYNDSGWTFNDDGAGAWVLFRGTVVVERKEIQKFTLSAQNIIDKYITLTQTPKEVDEIELTVVGGLQQDYGVDFAIMTGQPLRVTWDGGDGNVSTGLVGQLLENDKIIVAYSYDTNA